MTSKYCNHCGMWIKLTSLQSCPNCDGYLVTTTKTSSGLGRLYPGGEEITLSEKSKKDLEEINKEVDKLLEPLDSLIKPYGYNVEDIIWFNGELFVRDKLTGEKIYLSELEEKCRK